MTARELYQEYKSALKEKGMSRIDGINTNSNKSDLTFAIKCLRADDETLDKCMGYFKEIYPASADLILNNGDWKRHQFNRWYIYANGINHIK